MTNVAIEPFVLNIEPSTLEDLKRRLKAVRWPEPATAEGWVQGVPLDEMRRIRDYWLDHYDWRRCEAALNSLGQSRTVIDGLGIHFLHVRSPVPDAMPIILTHGWPGSVIEFLKVIGPLTDPVAHGGRASDAFHVVAPSLPGYGFSDKPDAVGWNIGRTARAWIELMRRLGYERYVAQGGDWGGGVTIAMGAIAPPALAAIHLNVAVPFPTPDDLERLSADEEEKLAALKHHRNVGSGYAELQHTRPQTIGYSLADSAIGQAGWIYEKYREWCDCDGDPTTVLSMDEMLDNIMLYWLPNTGTSSGRLYWEARNEIGQQAVEIPLGCSLFPKEMFRSSRRWAERRFRNIVYWNEPSKGGHFPALEQPELFVEEMRAFRKTVPWA